MRISDWSSDVCSSDLHRDPGQDVEISRFHHAALGSYADNLCEDALKQSRDLFGLNLALDGIADTLPRFISSELAGVANHDKEEALSRMDQAIEDLQRVQCFNRITRTLQTLSRMDQAIEDLQRARDAIEALPEEAKQTAKTVVACQSNVDDIRIAVLVDGKCVGQFYRERFAGRTWRDSILEMNDGPRIRGMTDRKSTRLNSSH